MKKVVLTSVLAGAMALTLGGLFNPADAVCPAKAPCAKSTPSKASPCENKMEKQLPPKGPQMMSPEEKGKIREEKKAEFEERMKLTESQKAQLEKIKADEKKTVAPIREELKKEHAKIDALFEKEKAVRVESMKKFESMLTPEQKTELEKIKVEISEEISQMAPPEVKKHECKPCAKDCKCPQHKK